MGLADAWTPARSSTWAVFGPRIVRIDIGGVSPISRAAKRSILEQKVALLERLGLRKEFLVAANISNFSRVGMKHFAGSRHTADAPWELINRLQNMLIVSNHRSRNCVSR
jgi:hypothetical protein